MYVYVLYCIVLYYIVFIVGIFEHNIIDGCHSFGLTPSQVFNFYANSKQLLHVKLEIAFIVGVFNHVRFLFSVYNH